MRPSFARFIRSSQAQLHALLPACVGVLSVYFRGPRSHPSSERVDAVNFDLGSVIASRVRRIKQLLKKIGYLKMQKHRQHPQQQESVNSRLCLPFSITSIKQK